MSFFLGFKKVLNKGLYEYLIGWMIEKKVMDIYLNYLMIFEMTSVWYVKLKFKRFLLPSIPILITRIVIKHVEF